MYCFSNAIFGSSAYSKGPLLLFLCSFLIWWYPLYAYRVSIHYLSEHYNDTSGGLTSAWRWRPGFSLNSFAAAVSGDTCNVELNKRLSLHVSGLERFHVDMLAHDKARRPRISAHRLRELHSNHKTGRTLHVVIIIYGFKFCSKRNLK